MFVGVTGKFKYNNVNRLPMTSYLKSSLPIVIATISVVGGHGAIFTVVATAIAVLVLVYSKEG